MGNTAGKLYDIGTNNNNVNVNVNVHEFWCEQMSWGDFPFDKPCINTSNECKYNLLYKNNNNNKQAAASAAVASVATASSCNSLYNTNKLWYPLI